jgi:uncharacterized protein (TIGR02145 family)
MKTQNLFQIFRFVLVLFFLMILNSCIRKDSILPVVVTADFISFDQTTITSGGEIFSEGSNHVTSRGVCWNTEPVPTIYNEHTVDGSGSGTFTSTITGLNPSVTYYFRAYARSKAGTAYGEEFIITTQRLPGPPVVTTSDISGISATTAQCAGNVVDDGDDQVTQRGICWYTEPDPTAYHTHTSDGTGNGYYSSKLTGLSPSVHYYARAYAINSYGIGYGNQVTFTTRDGVAILTTSTPTRNSSVSVHSGGIISDDGGSLITTRGICYSTTSNPTVANNKTINGTGSGSFTSFITGLSANSTYHIRAYATNALGTYYGNESTVTTLGTIADIEGNNYNIAIIGTQTWMADNLKTTKYRDGTDIPNITDQNVWLTLTTPGYCWYNNDANSYKSVYGALYNWYAVSNSLLCPDGWHVPSDNEWSTLVNFVGAQGSAVKLGIFGTNDFSFSAVTGGRLEVENNSIFLGDMGRFGIYWTSTEYLTSQAIGKFFNGVDYKMTEVDNYHTSKKSGQSVRCLHD